MVLSGTGWVFSSVSRLHTVNERSGFNRTNRCLLLNFPSRKSVDSDLIVAILHVLVDWRVLINPHLLGMHVFTKFSSLLGL